MSSRQKRNVQDEGSRKKRRKERTDATVDLGEKETSDLECDDVFGDEYEEEVVEELEDDDKLKVEEAMEAEEAAPAVPWRRAPLEEGQQLDFEPSAYKMFHQLRFEWSCLSFDVIRDKLGACRSRFPMTGYIVAGSQAEVGKKNKLLVLKMSDLHRMQHDEEEDDSEIEENEDDDPIVEFRHIQHKTLGCINRVKSMPQQPNIVAAWSDTRHVTLWDVMPHLRSLDSVGESIGSTKPVAVFDGHTDEGFAMAFSPLEAGRFASGGCDKNIFLWQMSGDSGWAVDSHPLVGHTDSVEDLAWSTDQAFVLASCSVDKTVKIWDLRSKKCGMSQVVHGTDVNVISWNPIAKHLLLSGADDGSFKVWDIRSMKKASFPAGGIVDDNCVAQFLYHQSPITSVEWDPSDESCLAVAEEDGVVGVWDMSAEADAEMGGEDDCPAQLLFEHMGQNSVKEVHFHPQLSGVLMSTALDSFHVFSPDIKVETEDE